MSKKLKKWEDFEQELNITPEQEAEIQLEMDLIEATIEARKKSNLSQRELSEKTGIKQPAIARIESRSRSPPVPCSGPSFHHNNSEGSEVPSVSASACSGNLWCGLL